MRAVEALVTDCRDVVNSLRRSRRFAATATVTFALGIGSNVGLLTMVDRLMFRSLPYGEQERLVQVHAYTSVSPTFSAAELPFEITSVLSKEAESFEGLGWVDAYPELAVPAPGENPLVLRRITVGAIELLKVSPLLGRAFIEADANGAPTRMVMLTEAAWQTRFGRSARVLEAVWSTGPSSYRVVGVLPSGFILPSSHFVEQFDGLTVSSRSRLGTGAMTIAPFGRLRPKVSLATAQAEVDLIVRRHKWAGSALRQGLANGTLRVTVQPLQSGLSVVVRPYLWLIAAAVWIVLCVACVNLATLLLARARSRQHESTIRVSLGASSARLVRIATLEVVVICAVGSAVALAACHLTYRSLVGWVPESFRGFAISPLDSRIMAMTLGGATVCALAVSALAAAGAGRVNLLTVLQQGGRGGRSPGRFGWLLLLLQAGFTAMLVAGAVATVPGFVGLLMRSPGFDAQDLFSVAVGHNWSRGVSPGEERRMARVDAILSVVEALPYVERAGAALSLPLYRSPGNSPFWKERGLAGDQWGVSASLFETLKTPVLAGRPFSEDEVRGGSRVAMFNESGVRAVWPGEEMSRAIGRVVQTAGGSRQIVGVVSDVRNRADSSPTPGLFLPITSDELQSPQSALPILVRMEQGRILDQALLTSRLNEVLPPNRVVVKSVQAEMRAWIDRPRFLATLFGSLATMAIILAAVGVYALASLEVLVRRYELVVRLALGATATMVRRQIALSAVVPTLAGTASGLMLTWWGGGLLGALVAEIDLRRWWLYAVALGVTSSTAVLAVWAPARRAARMDLASVLKSS